MSGKLQVKIEDRSLLGMQHQCYTWVLICRWKRSQDLQRPMKRWKMTQTCLILNRWRNLWKASSCLMYASSKHLFWWSCLPKRNFTCVDCMPGSYLTSESPTLFWSWSHLMLENLLVSLQYHLFTGKASGWTTVEQYTKALCLNCLQWLNASEKGLGSPTCNKRNRWSKVWRWRAL